MVKAGYSVVFAVNHTQKILLQKEGLPVTYLPLQGYGIVYGKTKWSFALTLLWQVPKILWAIYSEHSYVAKLVSKHGFIGVISDNRYGCWHKTVPSIFITHQLNIQTGNSFFNKVLQRVNAWFVNKFSACWVPDVLGEQSLAGTLSSTNSFIRKPVKYIGWLSKFLPITAVKPIFECCFLISGPEPQRTQFEQWVKQLCLQLPNSKMVVFLGKPTANSTQHFGENTTVYNHLPTRQMQAVLAQSKVIVCRSGYTTLMEMALLQKPCLVLPTTGQTEQEYLAAYLHSKNYCVAIEPSTLQNSPSFLQALHAAAFIEVQLPKAFKPNSIEALLAEVL